MNTTRIITLFLLIGLGLTIIGGCEKVQNIVTIDEISQEELDSLNVTMVYPNDCVGLAAYCTEFHIGVQKAKNEIGIKLTELNGLENDPIATEMILSEAAQTSDLVLTAGYQMGSILESVAPKFPNVKFAIFDVVIDLPNVASVNYKSNEGSFLVGSIAALKTKSNKIGFIGGVDVPLIREFEAGYIAGIHEINQDIEVIVKYISDDVTGFIQPDKAKEIALTLYDSGVDIIYVAAGGSGQGVLEAAQEKMKYIIWVDSNGNHLAPGIVLTSMVKEISSSVQTIIHETVNGMYMPGIRFIGIEGGGVDYTLDEHNQLSLTNNIINQIENIKEKIIAGDIIVPDTVQLPRQ
ncbi:BMP family ABC transporter substrate-binding protein [Candidatus Poribacteria bacterium]|nr:MAG: BMP family ABC transporter substrate-binding protein [Candidatus Poribacteria bacterium]